MVIDNIKMVIDNKKKYILAFFKALAINLILFTLGIIIYGIIQALLGLNPIKEIISLFLGNILLLDFTIFYIIFLIYFLNKTRSEI